VRQRLLDYIVPDFVHVSNGKIVKSGDASLALELEEKDTTGSNKNKHNFLFKV
jgi:Fe-S cluster assembly ATPase SufC